MGRGIAVPAAKKDDNLTSKVDSFYQTVQSSNVSKKESKRRHSSTFSNYYLNK